METAGKLSGSCKNIEISNSPFWEVVSFAFVNSAENFAKHLKNAETSIPHIFLENGITDIVRRLTPSK